MRRTFAESTPAHIPVLDGTAYNIPVPDGAMDAVVVAQAFHWFASKEALCEISRVLKPQGALVLIWNKDISHTSVPWAEKIRQREDSYSEGLPQYRTQQWIKAFDDQPYFRVPIGQWTALWDRYLTPESYWQRLLSVSFIWNLPKPEQDSFRDFVADVLKTDPSVEYTDKGEVKVPHDVRVAWAYKQ